MSSSRWCGPVQKNASYASNAPGRYAMLMLFKEWNAYVTVEFSGRLMWNESRSGIVVRNTGLSIFGMKEASESAMTCTDMPGMGFVTRGSSPSEVTYATGSSWLSSTERT